MATQVDLKAVEEFLRNKTYPKDILKDKGNSEKHFELQHCQRGFKGALSGLRQFLPHESPLKMMKNTFYFTSKALFVFKIFKFLS